jgi:hypothetical protein
MDAWLPSSWRQSDAGDEEKISWRTRLVITTTFLSSYSRF